jgi:hypothetical protein
VGNVKEDLQQIAEGSFTGFSSDRHQVFAQALLIIMEDIRELKKAEQLE